MEELPSVADKLARLAELENDFQRTLEIEKLEAMAEFAAGAGHEINNPLTVISGRAQLLLREEADPERQRALALISVQAMRVYEMIADMMLFARPPRPERRPVELVKLVDQLIAELAARCARQETTIARAGGASGPILIEADPVQLSVALRALCQNSIEALQSGGHIEIGVEIEEVLAEKEAAERTLDGSRLPEAPRGRFATTAGEVRIRISDDGPGIRPEDRRHIFDPFFSARQAGRGLGMGLAKAWRIVTNHGGRIDVQSEVGRGAAFVVTLPAGG